jgi:hypothetical protein
MYLYMTRLGANLTIMSYNTGVFKTIWGANAFFTFSTYKQCIFSQLYAIALLCFPQKPNILAGFEPGSSVPEADAMSTAPHHKDHFNTGIVNNTAQQIHSLVCMDILKCVCLLSNTL